MALQYADLIQKMTLEERRAYAPAMIFGTVKVCRVWGFPP